MRWAAFVMIVIALAWPRQAVVQTPPAFVCPVTVPSDHRPAADVNPFADEQAVIHEDGIWVSVSKDGVIELTPQDEILFGMSRGYRANEHTWLRDNGVEGFVLITGTRLDQPSERKSQNAVSPQRQYVKTGAVEASIAFPSAGCWEVTASVGEHSVTWVVEVRFLDGAATPALGFVCPVTLPNTSELHGLPKFLGDGMVYNEDDLWMAIPADGTWTYDPAIYGVPEEPEFAGWMHFKLHMHRGENAHGAVTVTGERLDQTSDLQAINDPVVDQFYGDSGFVPVALMIPSEGCWQFTVTAGDSSATWVLDVRVVNSVGTPVS